MSISKAVFSVAMFSANMGADKIGKEIEKSDLSTFSDVQEYSLLLETLIYDEIKTFQQINLKEGLEDKNQDTVGLFAICLRSIIYSNINELITEHINE